MFSISVWMAKPKMIVCMTGITNMKNSVDGSRRMCENSLRKMAKKPFSGRGPFERARRGARDLGRWLSSRDGFLSPAAYRPSSLAAAGPRGSA